MREWVRVVGVPVAFAVVATASAPGWTTYKVKRGDTLGEIAAAFDVSVAKLIDVNDLPGRGDLIYVGAVLRIPVQKKPAQKENEPGTTVTKTVLVDHKVALGDTLSGLAKKYGTEQSRIVKANKLSSDGIRLGETLACSMAAAAMLYPEEDCEAVLASLVNLGVFAADSERT